MSTSSLHDPLRVLKASRLPLAVGRAGVSRSRGPWSTGYKQRRFVGSGLSRGPTGVDEGLRPGHLKPQGASTPCSAAPPLHCSVSASGPAPLSWGPQGPARSPGAVALREEVVRPCRASCGRGSRGRCSEKGAGSFPEEGPWGGGAGVPRPWARRPDKRWARPGPGVGAGGFCPGRPPALPSSSG